MGKIDRSLLQGESFELFSAAIKSPATQDTYERKLLGYLKRINLSPDAFVQFAKDCHVKLPGDFNIKSFSNQLFYENGKNFVLSRLK